MSNGKNYRRFERPCLHLQGQAVQDLLDPSTLHQSTRQTPKKLYLRHKNCEQLESFLRPLSFHIRNPDFPCVISTTTQLPLKTHPHVVRHCHVIPLHILLLKVS